MDSKKIQNSKISTAGLFLVSAELFIALWVMMRFGLDPAKSATSAFLSLQGFLWETMRVSLDPAIQIGLTVFIAVALFITHALIPFRWRRLFALATSLALLVFIVGPSVFGLVVAIGFLLIGICHLPIAYRWRLLLVLSVAAILAAAQLGWVHGGRHLPGAIPVLGAIFMFRMMIYLYDIRHEKPGTVTFAERIGYFFLLPAPLFLNFFPTLDYKVHLRSFYARPAFDIYQTGMLWISRGVVHLVLYRIIYHFFSPSAEFVTDLGGVMAFCLSGYLVYLQVSGVFHIISGILRLFGYDLPETHRLYFFASGFSDYWRRINIYWKDFMAKVFFFPTFSALRRTGISRATKVTIATIAVFVATTVLHSYQNFWIYKDPTIHETDYWFWGILGFLVVINNLIDDRKNVKLPVANKAWEFKAALRLSLRVVGMFVLLCLLWALWRSEKLADFFDVMKQARNAQPVHFGIFFGFVGAALALGTLGQWAAHHGFHVFEERPRPVRSVATTVVPLLVLGGLWEYQHAKGIPGEFGSRFATVMIDQPNEWAEFHKERGYYDKLLNVNLGAPEEELTKDFTNPDIRGAIYRKAYGPVTAWGSRWSTNQWGMRDKSYEKEKPDGVYRIAVSGASYVAGRGVADGKNFESIIENKLNANGQTIEVLNFAFSDNGTLQRVADLELRMLEFKPDAIFLICHNGEAKRNIDKLAGVIASGDHELTYPYLKDLIAKLDLKPGDEKKDIFRALLPYADEILRWSYLRLLNICDKHGITPVWIYLPLTESYKKIHLADKGRKLPEEAGIHTIVLDKIYDGYSIDQIVVSDADSHPNEIGHQLIARRLLEKLIEQREKLGLPEEVEKVKVPPRP